MTTTKKAEPTKPEAPKADPKPKAKGPTPAELDAEAEAARKYAEG